MKVKKAQIKDFSLLAALHMRTWKETYEGLVPLGLIQQFSYENRCDQWEKFLQKKGQAFIVLSGGSPLGLSSYCIKGKTAEIMTIYVLKSHQNQSVGSRLLQSIKSALPPSASAVEAWCLENNPSRFFYEKKGFLPIRKAKKRIGKFLIQSICYRLDLKKKQAHHAPC